MLAGRERVRGGRRLLRLAGDDVRGWLLPAANPEVMEAPRDSSGGATRTPAKSLR
jgi:hypothetical protein